MRVIVCVMLVRTLVGGHRARGRLAEAGSVSVGHIMIGDNHVEPRRLS